jgi:hypothetical protein
MVPKLNHTGLIADTHRLGHQQSLEHFTHISQVKRIVQFRWCGQHGATDLLVQLQSGLHNASLQILHFRLEQIAFQEPLEDLAKNHVQGGTVRSGQVENREMARESRSEGIATSSRGCSHGHTGIIIDAFVEQSCPVIETRTVHELSQQLDRRLGAILFHLGHVDIIDQNAHFLAGRRD